MGFIILFIKKQIIQTKLPLYKAISRTLTMLQFLRHKAENLNNSILLTVSKVFFCYTLLVCTIFKCTTLLKSPIFPSSVQTTSQTLGIVKMFFWEQILNRVFFSSGQLFFTLSFPISVQLISYF